MVLFLRFYGLRFFLGLLVQSLGFQSFKVKDRVLGKIVALPPLFFIYNQSECLISLTEAMFQQPTFNTWYAPSRSFFQQPNLDAWQAPCRRLISDASQRPIIDAWQRLVEVIYVILKEQPLQMRTKSIVKVFLVLHKHRFPLVMFIKQYIPVCTRPMGGAYQSVFDTYQALKFNGRIKFSGCQAFTRR